MCDEPDRVPARFRSESDQGVAPAEGHRAADGPQGQGGEGGGEEVDHRELSVDWGGDEEPAHWLEATSADRAGG